MKVLLDTHALLWAIAYPDKFTTHTKRLLTYGGTQVFFSAISLYEIARKQAAGRLHVPDSFEREVEKCGFIPLALTHTHALRAGGLGGLHGDPFDRFLVAQALVENLTLITRDAKILAYPVSSCEA